MTQQGFIKLQRKIQQHWIYQEKRKFSKYEAWLDMLMMANHKPNKFVLGNELIELEKGQFVSSELKLMDRWDWGKAKLRKFLEMLEKDNMIIKKSDRKKTTITICNYCIYHDYETESRPQADHKQTDSRPQADTNKNVKNDKNEKENIYRQFKHLSMSNNEFERLLKEGYSKEDIDDTLDRIENYKNNKKYSNLLLTCRNWMKKDKNIKPKEVKKAEYKSDSIEAPKELFGL